VPRFNDREQFLLRNWPDAKLIADDMAVVRRKYRKVFDDVLQAFRQRHPELDWPYQDKLKDKNLVDLCQFGIGKRNWPSVDESPSGLYVGNLELENVTGTHSPDLQPPERIVWLALPDPEDAKQQLLKAAGRVLPKDELPEWEPRKEGKWSCIARRIEPAEELFYLLISEESGGFVERMVGHLESMMKFVPVIDEIVGKRGRK
jgi:hypothetical protein